MSARKAALLAAATLAALPTGEAGLVDEYKWQMPGDYGPTVAKCLIDPTYSWRSYGNCVRSMPRTKRNHECLADPNIVSDGVAREEGRACWTERKVSKDRAVYSLSNIATAQKYQQDYPVRNSTTEVSIPAVPTLLPSPTPMPTPTQVAILQGIDTTAPNPREDPEGWRAYLQMCTDNPKSCTGYSILVALGILGAVVAKKKSNAYWKKLKQNTLRKRMEKNEKRARNLEARARQGRAGGSRQTKRIKHRTAQ
jgi:hypothetical protein